ncbi:MAG TPA: GNAT family N-acetyltransferase [Planctomycetota bacterium]|nr:GNAT family N-acetyltransferase [Planctomycetota bacterium]
MTIRRANADDAISLASVHVDSWHAAYRGLVPDTFLEQFAYERRAERFRQSLAANSEETYIIEEDGKAMGFLTLGACRDADAAAGRTGEIWGIYVAPAHWRKGMGRQLCEFGEQLLSSRGYQEATLWVLEANQSARRFYEAMGFHLDGASKEVKLGVPLQAVRYRKNLQHEPQKKCRSSDVLEVTDAASPYLSEIEAILRQTHPGCDPYFRTILRDLRRADGKHEAQVFAAVHDGHAVGFSQVFYREWRGGLVGWLDLLDVLHAQRVQGVGTALARRSIEATIAMASLRGLPAIGTLSLIDPGNAAVVPLHGKLGGQIRRDLSYRTPLDPADKADVLVWHPCDAPHSGIATKALAWQAWQFGGLTKEQFEKRYGPADEVR